MVKIQNLRGVRDFYPSEQRNQLQIFNAWRTVCRKYNFEEYNGPTLELAQLWEMKSGGDIPDEMYSFTARGGERVALRPEMTPTLTRMIAAKQQALAKPMKWFSLPTCYRCEAPQSGRLREFVQLNVDILGTKSMIADAEVIMTLIDIYRFFLVTSDELFIRLGNRKLIQSLIFSCGVTENQYKDVARLIDKKEKITDEAFFDQMQSIGLQKEQVEKIVFLLSTKDLSTLKDLDEKGKEGVLELQELYTLLCLYGVQDWISIDLFIMRGFDYYTSTVFEAYDRSKKLRAVAGGGRYDDLVSDFGGQSCPGVGYGASDITLEIFLKQCGKWKEVDAKVDYYIALTDQKKEVLTAAISLVSQLRKNATVDFDIMQRPLKKQLAYADAIGAQNIIVFGDDEAQKKSCIVKNKASGNEHLIEF